MAGRPVDGALTELALDLERALGGGCDAPWPDGRFADFARRAFALQHGAIPAYRAYCEARGIAPGDAVAWDEIPPVPATAYKHLELAVGGAEGAERVFRTSGTSRGAAARGRHAVPRLSLYRASCLPPFVRAVVPPAREVTLLSLVPSPVAGPDSSLSTMVGFVAEEVAAETRWLAEADGADDVPGSAGVAARLRSAAAASARSGRPAVLVGTAFAFVHLLDALAEPCPLPPGSTVMETGGYKGRAREVPREELYGALAERLALPASRIVNEYGMTELLSQLYEPSLRLGRPERVHEPPPWLRVRALDPDSLAPLPPGDTGVLAFFDLANAGSVCAILTEDLGAVDARGVHLVGRAPGSEPRGCSLAMEELLEAAG